VHLPPSIRIKDIDLLSNPARLFVRGETTKTKVDRMIFLSQEMVQQLKSWLEYKYRKRRVCYKDKVGKTITEYRTPHKKDTDLIFAVCRNAGTPEPASLYREFEKFFAKTLDRMGKGNREEGNVTESRKVDVIKGLSTSVTKILIRFICIIRSGYETNSTSTRIKDAAKVKPFLL
jgi:hypothetical protein